MSDEAVSTPVQVAALAIALSGGYHLADGVAMFASGVGDATLNVLFATLSVVVGVGLVLSGTGLFLVGSGGWFLGAGLVVLCAVLLDVMSVLLRGGLASVLDVVLLLAALVVVVRVHGAETSGRTWTTRIASTVSYSSPESVDAISYLWLGCSALSAPAVWVPSLA